MIPIPFLTMVSCTLGVYIGMGWRSSEAMVFPFVQALGSKEIWDNAEIQLKAPLKELRNYIGEMNDDAVATKPCG